MWDGRSGSVRVLFLCPKPPPITDTLAGIVPGLGDVTDVILNYTLVVRPATKLDLPGSVTAQMFFNNAVSAGVGLVPLVGDVALAAWKANWRNAHILEEYLRHRGAENLAKGERSGLTELSDPEQAQLAADLIGAAGEEVPMHEAAAGLQQPLQAPAPEAKKKGKFWSKKN